MEPVYSISSIRAIIGLGNPGSKYAAQRHNIGFRVVEALVDQVGGSWHTSGNMQYATVRPAGVEHDIYVIKPQTFMNSSGQVLPWLTKKGIKPDQILVVHDELEKKFGQLVLKLGGSHKGHNGLKSIIAGIGAEFWRLKVGIDRPEDRDAVPDYVLTNFPPEHEAALTPLVQRAVSMLLD